MSVDHSGGRAGKTVSTIVVEVSLSSLFRCFAHTNLYFFCQSHDSMEGCDGPPVMPATPQLLQKNTLPCPHTNTTHKSDVFLTLLQFYGSFHRLRGDANSLCAVMERLLIPRCYFGCCRGLNSRADCLDCDCEVLVS